MDPRLLRYYNEELRHLREMGAEFAQQFPKIAARLGVEGLEVTDPYVERLLEGFAFLAGRIQLKLDAEFPRFTQRMLEILYPQFLAPLPAMLIAQVQPELGESSLAQGVKLPRGAMMNSLAGKAGATACEFRTAHALTLWPLELSQVEYFTHAADLPIAAVPEWRRYRAGLRLRLNTTGGMDFTQIALQDLRLHLTGIDDIAYRLHELICGQALGVLVLPSKRPAAWHEALDGECIVPVGFEDEEALLPQTLRGFEGYRLLQEYFAFPQRFMFFDIEGVGEALRRHGGKEVDIVILFSRADNALQQAVDAGSLALHCVPAINLLERRCDRIQVSPDVSAFHVVPDRTRPMDYEVHSITEVLGYGAGANSEWRFLPFYNAFHTESRSHAAYYSLQREPRMLSQNQQRDGPRTAYIGTEVHLSVVDAKEAPFSAELRQLGVRALCTNRDLPLLMPLGGAKGDLILAQTAPVKRINVIKGPSRPQSALREGSVAWKLINQLSLNHLSLSDADAEHGAAALREILRLYAPAGDASAQRQVDGLRSVKLESVVRRLPMAGPITFGRGVDLKVEVDDHAFEGGSAFLLGCVLERFVARHVSMNGFTQLRLHSASRGDILKGEAAMRDAPDPLKPEAPGPDPLPGMAAEPWRYDFFHALRLIEAQHPDKPRLGTARRPVDEPIRLGQAADLGFAPASLSAVDLADRSGRPRIEVRFFGLFGPNGPLPLHMTSYARERKLHRGDETFGRFADMFHHRLLLLFYRAWAQAQPAVSLDRGGEDRFAAQIGSLIGTGGEAWAARDAAPDHARLAFAGLFARQVRNADGLAHLLSAYLGMPVRVEQFVGRWMPLPEGDRTRIGRRAALRRQSTSQLGVSAVLGRSVFDRQHQFRIHLGPLKLGELEALLPVGAALPAVKALVQQYVGLEYGWDLRLTLSLDEVPRSRLGRHGRLGWTTWLGRPARGKTAALNLNPHRVNT